MPREKDIQAVVGAGGPVLGGGGGSDGGSGGRMVGNGVVGGGVDIEM